MKHNSETILDESGIELLIGYDYESTDGYYEEPTNIASFVEPLVYTELKSVEVVIKGTGIDILPFLNEKQTSYLISLLNYE